MAAATRHNGGRSQINFNFIGAYGEFPFLNLLKTADEWSLVTTLSSPNNVVLPSNVDSNGYPTTIPAGTNGVNTIVYTPSLTARPGANAGKYRIRWDGNGTITTSGLNISTLSGSNTSSTGSGEVTIQYDGTALTVGISVVGSPRITNMRVYHLDDETLLETNGEVFGAKFKARLIEANPGYIRFLNWQVGNTSQVTDWTSRRSSSYFTWGGKEIKASIFGGTTGGTGDTFTVSAPPGWAGLVDKALVQVNYDHDALTGNATLNVGGSGAKKILGPTGETNVDSGNFPQGGTFRSLSTLVYDADLNGWVGQGGNQNFGRNYFNSGCPLEICLQLAAEIGSHPWFVAPMFALDPMTDWYPSLMAYCRDNGPSWMKPVFEGCNELWNPHLGFWQTAYAEFKAAAHGWATFQTHNWVGKTLSTIGQAASIVYAADRTKYDVAVGFQTITGDSTGNIANNVARMTSDKYVSDGVAQSGYTATAASNWVTCGCVATYFRPAISTALEDAMVTEFEAATGARKQEIANAYSDLVNLPQGTSDGFFTIQLNLSYYQRFKTFLQTYSIQKLLSYEGGYSPDMEAGGTSAKDRLKAASANNPRLRDYILAMYASYTSISDATFTAASPSCFQMGGDFNFISAPNNIWSVLNDIYVTPDPPQWLAIKAYNSARRANPLRLRLHG